MIMSSPCNNSVNQWIYFVSGSENAILGLLIPATIVANVSVIYSIIRTRQVNDGVNNMFICLSICDCFVAAVTEVGMLLLLTVFRSKRICQLELLIQYSSSFLCNLSGMLILSIAIDRYIQTRKTIKMRFDRNRRISIFLMIISLIVALIVAGLDVLGTLMIDYAWMNMAIQFAQLIALLSICIVYIMMYYTVSRNRKKQDKVLNLQGKSRQKRLNVTYVRRMIATTTIILTALLVSYFPLLVLGIHTVLRSAKSYNSPIQRKFANYLSFLFGFSNSFLSAVIYLHRNRGCRNYILKRFNLLIGKTYRRAIVSPSRSVAASRKITVATIT